MTTHPDRADGTSVRLRLGTYNLHDLHDDRDALVEVLRAMRADVVCVQEVPRHPAGLRSLGRLASRAGLRTPRHHAFGGGTTVLVGSRVAVAGLRHEPLRVPLGQRRRGLACLDGVVGGVLVRVVSIHLGLHPVQRVRHTHRILEVASAGPAAVLVAGDANETLDGRAMRLARRELAVLGDAVPTYPAARPSSAIDVLLARGVVGAREVEVEVAEGVLRRASDHRPRVVEVDL